MCACMRVCVVCMGADADEGGTMRIGGYSIDSDEEDVEAADAQKSRYEEKDEDMYVPLDAEFNDGGAQLTGFNMEEENEDGHINADGDFIAKKKDLGEEADAWLDGVSMYVPGTGVNTVIKESTIVTKAARPRGNVVEEMLAIMKERETVLMSIRRLGGKGGGSGRKFELKKS